MTVLDLDRYVPALINFISNKMSVGASEIYKELFGIGVAEWRIMSLLAIETDISANRICQLIGFDKAVVSRTLQRMSAKALITVSPSQQDRRRLTIVLTTKGLGLHDQVIKVALAREQRLLAGFEPEEIDILVSYLRRMHQKMAEVNAPGLQALVDAPASRPRRRRQNG